MTERGTKPFDATTKALIDADPLAWLALGRLVATGPVTPFDPNLDTIQAEADKVVLVNGPTPWLAHFEIQAGRDRALLGRLLQYSALLYRRHGQAVRSVLVLLRRESDAPDLTGRLTLADPDGRPYLEFQYTVVRAWEQSVEAVLAAGLGTLPLATLADVAPSDLPDVVRRIGQRLDSAPTDQAGLLWTATYFLLGLRRDVDVDTKRLIEGVRAMRESSTYQAVLAEGRAEGQAEGRAEGRAEGARRILLRLGTQRLGPPDAQTLAALEAIRDVEQLETLAGRLDRVSGWAELSVGP